MQGMGVNPGQSFQSAAEVRLAGTTAKSEQEVNLFRVQQKSLKLQQTQEAGSIFINEVKNIVVTVVAATAVIHGQVTLGMMLAAQYIIGQLRQWSS